MKKIKQFIQQWQDSSDSRIRKMCEALSPKCRIVTILMLCLLFGVCSIYLTVNSIYNIGWRDAGRQCADTTSSGSMKIEHIKGLDIPTEKKSGAIISDTIYKPLKPVTDEKR